MARVRFLQSGGGKKSLKKWQTLHLWASLWGPHPGVDLVFVTSYGRGFHPQRRAGETSAGDCPALGITVFCRNSHQRDEVRAGLAQCQAQKSQLSYQAARTSPQQGMEPETYAQEEDPMKPQGRAMCPKVSHICSRPKGLYRKRCPECWWLCRRSLPVSTLQNSASRDTMGA